MEKKDNFDMDMLLEELLTEDEELNSVVFLVDKSC